jgi:hypothetical protein
VAYRAEIQIGVKGVEELTKLQKRLEGTNFKIDEINKKQSTTFGGLAQSIQNYAQQLNLAEKALSKVAAATPQETRAVNNYVTALGNANAARERQNRLIEQEIANRTGATAALKAYNAAAAAPTQRGAATTMSGAYMRGAFNRGTTQFTDPIGPISAQARTARAEGIAREAALKSQANQKEFAAQKAFQTELFNIEKRFDDSLNRQRKEADDAEFDRLLKRLNAEQSKLNEIDKLRAKIDKKIGEDFDKRSTQAGNLRGQSSPVGGAVNIPGSPAAKARTKQIKRLQGAASNAIIGGAFPLLFGQGIGASVGGAVGGAGGGLMGGQFGFGLSLVGTAVGTAVDNLIKSTSELGKALNPLTADIGAVTAAAGESGTAFEQLTKDIEKVLGKEKALAVATAQLATVIGDDGVTALKEFGQDTSNLSAELTKAFTAVSASTAEFINKLGILSSVTKRIEIVRLANKEGTTPEIRKLQEERDSFDKGLLFGGDPQKVEQLNQQIAALQKIAEEEERIQVIKQAQRDLQAAVDAETASSIVMLEQKLIIAKNNGDLLNEQVVAAMENVAAEEIRVKILKAQGDPLKLNLVYLEAQLKAVQRINQVEQARKRKQEEDARKAQQEAQRAQQEAQRAQRELEARNRGISSAQVGSMQALIAGSRAGLQSTRVFEGEKAFLDESEKALEYEVRLKTRILDIQYKQRASQAKSQEEAEHLFNTYNTQYDTIERVYFTQLKQVQQQKEQLKIQKEINALQQAEETSGITRGFTRNIADVERRIASPFGGDDSDMLNLRIEQLRRTEDIYRDIDTQVSILNKQLKADPSNEIISDNIKGLEERRQKLEALLPVLDQVEQAELRQNQLVEKYGFIANEAATAMSSAVQSIVTGTGSVEEAFSNMFANIGKAFIDMATQMIAKALIMKAIGILGNAFGGGGSSGGGGDIFADIASRGGLRANGGPVSANTPYIVGERGPELMVPSTSGMVLSNSETRQQLNNQQSAASTREQLDKQQAVASTREQLNNQQAVAMQPLDIRYESTVINNVEYVTAEQHRQGMAQAAERGRAMTLTTLQNSPRTRSKVGI